MGVNNQKEKRENRGNQEVKRDIKWNIISTIQINPRVLI